MQLEDLDKITDKIEEICALLNPEDAYWIKDLLVKQYEDEDVLEQVIEMMIRMGYEDPVIIQVGDKIKELLEI